GPRFRFVSRVRPRNKASRVRSFAKRTRREYREFQRWSGNRSGRRVNRSSHRPELLANTRRLSAARISHEYRTYDGWFCSNRISVGGLLVESRLSVYFQTVV